MQPISFKSDRLLEPLKSVIFWGGMESRAPTIDSNAISSVTRRWLPRSRLAVKNVLSASFARPRLVSPSKWNWNDRLARGRQDRCVYNVAVLHTLVGGCYIYAG